MAVRNIMLEGEEVLRKHAHPVDRITRRIRVLLDDMAETMYANDGAGLAAPQVGILRRVVVIDAGEGLIELINPVIVETEGSMVNPEGCLSIPGRRCTVERPERVVVEALDRNGKPIRVEGTGLLAMALCHELDHLDGILYTDKMIEDVTDQYTNEAQEQEETES
ncbi:MAG: peptide deformylase [Clostridia bacterium]|nr:peptide deformylase [Clostridia bacterium]